MPENEIILGDAYSLIKTLPDHSIDLIVTDPPYEYDSFSGVGIAGQEEYFKELKEANIDKGFDLSLLDEFVRVLKNINMYVWVSKKQFKKVLDYMVDKYGCKWDLLVWHKTNVAPLCNNQYLHDCEYCLFFRKGAPLNTRYETAKTVFASVTNQADKKLYGHPTIKPQSIIETLIENSSAPGAVVLDPFIGSGTTAAAAKRLGRRYIGFEMNPKFHKIAIDRLNGVTQKELRSGYKQEKLF